MDQRAAEIIKNLSDKRQRLADNMGELERRGKQASDWRSYFGRNPWAMVGVALGGGLLLSGLLPARHHDRLSH